VSFGKFLPLLSLSFYTLFKRNRFAFPEFEKGGKKPDAGIGAIPG
jgi:hypothetical protein